MSTKLDELKDLKTEMGKKLNPILHPFDTLNGHATDKAMAATDKSNTAFDNAKKHYKDGHYSDMLSAGATGVKEMAKSAGWELLGGKANDGKTATVSGQGMKALFGLDITAHKSDPKLPGGHGADISSGVTTPRLSRI